MTFIRHLINIILLCGRAAVRRRFRFTSSSPLTLVSYCPELSPTRGDNPPAVKDVPSRPVPSAFYQTPLASSRHAPPSISPRATLISPTTENGIKANLIRIIFRANFSNLPSFNYFAQLIYAHKDGMHSQFRRQVCKTRIKKS